MATKVAIEKAYKAGYSLPDVNWDPVKDVTTPEQRTLGVHHNPFDPRDPDQVDESNAWLKGLKARLEEPTKDPATVLKEVKDALGGKS